MSNCKFIDEFLKITQGAYPELKLRGAIYYQASKELSVQFLLNAFEYKKFTEDSSKTEGVQRAVEALFPGIKVAVSYIKTYADETVVKNKILEYCNANNQMIFKRLADSTLDIKVNDGLVRVTFKFDPATCKMLTAGSFLEDVKLCLERTFTERIDVDVEESHEAENEDDSYFKTTTVAKGASLRLVEVRVGERLYARNKIENISRMPNYIADIKSAVDNAVLCGRISAVQKRKYKNKKHDPNDQKSGPEELPLLSFYINDTTGKMEAVCFPRADDGDCLDSLNEGDEVVCIGRVATSNFSGQLSYTVNAVFRCTIDYTSIHPVDRLPAPERYEYVKPQPYKGVREQDLFDSTRAKIIEYLNDRNYVVFDLETTSTSVPTTEIIEIGAIKIEHGEATETFSTLVRPKEHIPEGATQVNHIDDSMVAFAPPIEKVMPDFYKFVGDATLVGHNIEGFDVPIIRRIGEEMGYYFDNDTVDTLLLARTYMPERHSFSLENIARDLALTHTDAHRALSDVEANMELFFELIARKLKSKSGK